MSALAKKKEVQAYENRQRVLSIRINLQDIAGTLQEALTQRLTAYCIGISDGRDIGRYTRGERNPHRSTEERLRSLHHLVTLLRFRESDRIIQMWLTGKNPLLDERSPAAILRENAEGDFDRVLSAAENFLISG